MAKYFQGSLILLFSIFMLHSCSIQPRELTTAEQLMETSPDSALHILQKFHYDKYILDKNKAWYGVLLMQALDKNILPLQPDSIIDFSVQYYEKHSDNLLLAKAYYFKGRSLINKLQYEKATLIYLKSLDLVENTENYNLLGKIYVELGEIYILQRDYNTSRLKYQFAYENFIKADDIKHAFYTLLYIGRTYGQAKDLNNALLYFRKAYISSNDSLLKGVALQEIANNYYLNKKYDSAINYFKSSFKYPTLTYNRAIQYYNISNIYFNLNQIDSSYVYVKKALNTSPDIRTKRECYRILTNIAGEKSDMLALRNSMKNYQDCSDSIRRIDAQTKGSVLETIHESKKEVSKSHNWIVSLALIVIIGGLLIILMLPVVGTTQQGSIG
ncbi:MAG: tetratricopeptide repeat protein [Paludibacter sp.]